MKLDSDAIALLALVVGVIALLPPIHQNIKQDLTDPKVRAKLAKRLREPAFERQYREFLAWGLQVLDRLFGDKLLGLRAYGVCLTLALVYSMALFVVGWAIGGPGGIGSLQTLPEDWPVWRGGLGLAIMLVAAWLIHWVFRHGSTWMEKIEGWMIRRGIPPMLVNGMLRLLGAVMIYACAWWLIGNVRWAGLVFAVVIVLGAASVPAVLLILSMGWSFAYLSMGKLFIAAGTLGLSLIFLSSFIIERGGFVMVLGALFLGIGFNQFSGQFDAEIAANTTLFWVFLPLANALLDWLSWAISRALGREILRRQSWATVLKHGLLDAVLAVVLLVLLAMLLAAGIESVNLWFAGHDSKPPVDAVRLLAGAREQPFGPGGLWVTMMLVSTLIPTLLHVFSLCLALLTRLTPDRLRHWMLAILEAPEPDLADLTNLALLRILAWPVAVVAVLVLVKGLLDAIASAAAPVSELLYALAQWTMGSLRATYGA